MGILALKRGEDVKDGEFDLVERAAPPMTLSDCKPTFRFAHLYYCLLGEKFLA